MGYTTYFDGAITIEPPLNEMEIAYLNKFSETRRMDREKGPYYCGRGMCGQDHEADIRNYNCPPAGQPSLWCQWIATPEGDAIRWDDGEKFYKATEWMQYIIDHFLGKDPLAKLNQPEEFVFLQGHTLNGEIFATGEESGDNWKIVVKDNIVTEHQGRIVYDDEC